MVDPSIIATVKEYLQRLSHSGLSVAFGVIFGSQVSGRANALSDIDLIVVSPQFDGKISRDAINMLWRVAAKTDSRIEPIPCGQKQWQDNPADAIIEIARNEGATIES
ncbi:MAG: nucleotidyltransferase domain-containing protein [Sedimentisphaerales bacterium]|nr:nucleotidyltransferase domain-containing protein [Sedimentisphaerales bacterium]